MKEKLQIYKFHYSKLEPEKVELEIRLADDIFQNFAVEEALKKAYNKEKVTVKLIKQAEQDIKNGEKSVYWNDECGIEIS